MGNPFCPYCKQLLITRSFSPVTRFEQGVWDKIKKGLKIVSGDIIRGRSKYWFCRRCKRKWKKGGERIMRKG